MRTYAVVFTPLTSDQKTQLYVSVFSSFISIGYAFSTIDMFQGGRMLVKLPGYCKSFDGRFAMVLLFRVAEITSRATSLALFQTVTRPYGMFMIIAADGIIMSFATMFFQCHVAKFAPVERCSFLRQNFFYVIPSVLFCRMAPILEKDTVITVPPLVYYTIRYLELGAMVAMAGEFLDWDLEEAGRLGKTGRVWRSSKGFDVASQAAKRKITKFQEMRQLLGIDDAIDASPVSASKSVASTAAILTFGSKSRWKMAESNETVKKAEEAQALLERAVQKEVIRVVLCSSISDLEKGIVREKFKPFESSTGVPDLAKIRNELPSLYNGRDVRLLFSGLDFDRQHEESQQALDSLQKYISMAKTAGGRQPSYDAAFPKSPELDVLY
eukprot:Skav222721  [mRNA]  locus=scaffold2390:32569:50724:+ [translate_table: standard]